MVAMKIPFARNTLFCERGYHGERARQSIEDVAKVSTVTVFTISNYKIILILFPKVSTKLYSTLYLSVTLIRLLCMYW